MRARSLLLTAGLTASFLVGAAPATADQHAGGWLKAACPAEQTPASSYGDVEGNAHLLGINCLTWYGVAAGLGDNRFGPERLVRRDQMASFLAGALRALRVELPPSEDRFTDLEDNVHRDAVERLAAAGVISGTGPGTYGPAQPVTRGQLASLLLNTYAYFADGPPAEPRYEYFADDNGTVHEPSINSATELGLVTGYVPGSYDAANDQYRGDGRYEPTGHVRRDQMSSFVGRLLGHGTQAALGGSSRPYPRGAVVRLLDGWDAQILGSDDDADAEVEAQNAGNAPPAEGHRFVVVRVRGTYRGSGVSSFDGADRLVGRAILQAPKRSDARTYSASGRPCGDIPEELPNTAVPTGGSVEGNLCFEVREEHEVLPYDGHWGKPTAPHLGLRSESGQTASPYTTGVPDVPADPPATAPATLTWFDEPPRFGGEHYDGGAQAIHRSEPGASMTSSVSSSELHVGSFLRDGRGLGTFQSVDLYALGTRVIAPGRFVIGRDVELSLDNGSTCYARYGEVVIHDLVVSGGLLASAAVSIKASYAGSPSYSVCHGEVDAEVRWNSTRPVLAPEHLGATDVGRVPVATASARQTWTVSNDGSLAIDLAAVRTAGEHAGDLTVLDDGCSGRRLLPGQACTVEVTTTPTAPGARRALLEVRDNTQRGARTLLVLSEGVVP